MNIIEYRSTLCRNRFELHLNESKTGSSITISTWPIIMQTFIVLMNVMLCESPCVKMVPIAISINKQPFRLRYAPRPLWHH